MDLSAVKMPDSTKNEALRPEQSVKTVENSVQSVENTALPDYKLLGEALKLYILVETGGELLLIDKHAAHERMIFDRLKQQDRSVMSQTLLESVTLRLGEGERELLEENGELLGELGFEIEAYGEDDYILRAVPADMEPADARAAGAEEREPREILRRPGNRRRTEIPRLFGNRDYVARAEKKRQIAIAHGKRRVSPRLAERTREKELDGRERPLAFALSAFGVEIEYAPAFQRLLESRVSRGEDHLVGESERFGECGGECFRARIAVRLEDDPEPPRASLFTRHGDRALHFRRVVGVVGVYLRGDLLETAVWKFRDGSGENAGYVAWLVPAPQGDLDGGAGVLPVVRREGGDGISARLRNLSGETAERF
jgi:hypothetical protein